MLNRRVIKTLNASGAIAALLLVSACGTDDTTSETPSAEDTAQESTMEEETEEPADMAEETEEPAEEESEDAGAPAGDVAAPGTELAFGEAAVVEYEYAGESGLLELTVLEVEEGEPADLEPLDMGDQAAGLVPFYIHVEVSGVDDSSSALTYADLGGDIEGLLGDGSKSQLFSIIGDFEPCDSSALDGEFGPDSTTEICIPTVAGEGSAVESVQFAPYEGDYNGVDGQPIIWGN